VNHLAVNDRIKVILAEGKKMNNFQKTGGVAALIDAATFLVGIALAFTILAPYATGALDPEQTVAFLADNQAIMYVKPEGGTH
jgi:hypothetical protein